MRQCQIIEAQTPKGFRLSGLWFGPEKPVRAIIWLHGLQSSAFGGTGLRISAELVDSESAVILFSNRGHDSVAMLPHRNKKRRIMAGTTHEVFTDCVDDIEGMIGAVKACGAREIYLLGHSTGCQKSAYWAAKKGKGVNGLIWLAPISDYAGAMHHRGKAAIAKAAKAARALVAKGKPHDLVPPALWPGELLDAQRFLSLYSPDSHEEIFSYAQPERRPAVFERIKVPVLAIFAGRDEHADRPAKQIAGWFTHHAQNPLETKVIAGARHGFDSKEGEVAFAIRNFMKSSL